MAKKSFKCKNGKLKSPVINADGSKRYCKLKKKTSAGRSQDRKKKSGEAHEVRYRKKKRMSKSKKR